MELLGQLQQDLPSFALDILRLNIWLLLLMIIFVPLERLCAIHPQKLFRRGIVTDLAYYFLSGLVPKMLLVLPMTLIAWSLHRGMPHALQSQAGALPLWVRFPAALVVGEIGFYWGHRLAHEIPFLWRFHAIHHSAEELDWLVNTRAHPLDIAFVRFCGFVPIYALGLARPMAGNRVDIVPLLIMFIGTLWGFFIHANVCWRFGWLEWLVSTPAFHHWHHTNDEHINKNYASMLPFMDKLFGTCHLPAKQWPLKYGIDNPPQPALLRQLLQPMTWSKSAGFQGEHSLEVINGGNAGPISSTGESGAVPSLP
jgi:sterol desaturase/sphingolipid hydroxylase (fatty acid hydroxylase superfamily)